MVNLWYGNTTGRLIVSHERHKRIIHRLLFQSMVCLTLGNKPLPGPVLIRVCVCSNESTKMTWCTTWYSMMMIITSLQIMCWDITMTNTTKSGHFPVSLYHGLTQGHNQHLLPPIFVGLILCKNKSGRLCPSSFVASDVAIYLSEGYTSRPVSLCNLKQTIGDKINKANDNINDNVGALNRYTFEYCLPIQPISWASLSAVDAKIDLCCLHNFAICLRSYVTWLSWRAIWLISAE